MTERELRVLQDKAAGRFCLEIGSWYGYSAIGMALAGATVVSVDPHRDGPADAPETWLPFLDNCRRHHVDERIIAYRGRIEDAYARGWLEKLPAFGLVFVDGDHVYPAPVRDAEIAMAHLAPGGWLCFHDVDENWPGVRRAVAELEAAGWELQRREGCLNCYRLPL